MGRRRTLDRVKQGQICAMISLGCSRRAAAGYVGCATSTIRHTAMHDPQFRERLRQAEQTAEIGPLHRMQHHATKSWRAAAWLLERMHPDRYIRAPRTMTFEELSDLLIEFGEGIIKEIADPETCRRIAGRIDQWQRWCAKQSSAANDRLLDGRKKKSRRGQSPARIELGEVIK